MSRFLLLLGIGLAWGTAAFPQAPPPAPLTISFDDALKRAQANSLEILSADVSAKLALEDRVQAKAGLLPSVNWLNQFIYTQPNGSDTGVYIASNGPHEYTNQAVVHGEIFSPAKRAGYRMSQAAEAAARAKVEIAARGLAVTVVEGYYGLVSAGRKQAGALSSLTEAERFLGISQKQEAGGEVAHADVVKAQIQAQLRRRELQEAQLAIEKARIGLAVLIFPDYRQDFAVVDDLDTIPSLPPFQQIQDLAGKSNPEIRAAQETIRQQTFGVKAARGEMLPTLSFDYLYGINARQYAIHNSEQLRNLGSSVQAELSVPVWNWGTGRSKIRQAELRLQQANAELTYTQRRLLGQLNTFYREADAAAAQHASLRSSVDLAAESVRLTLLGYEAGEATALEVVDAQATQVEARNAADEGLLRYRLALANLQTLTGTF
jgi:outer membrane protein TolC